MQNAPRIWVSSLGRGHADPLCLILVLVNVLPEWARKGFLMCWLLPVSLAPASSLSDLLLSAGRVICFQHERNLTLSDLYPRLSSPHISSHEPLNSIFVFKEQPGDKIQKTGSDMRSGVRAHLPLDLPAPQLPSLWNESSGHRRHFLRTYHHAR